MDSQPIRSDTGVIANVPAITIAAFCESEGLRMVMKSAAADRRMSRASCIVEMGGVPAAAAAYAETRTPAVLIVEMAEGRNMLEQLRPLAEVCDPSTLVVVVGHVNDVLLYRELLRNGIAEYLAAPLTQLQMIDAIAGLFRDPASQPAGRIIAFVGAKGGSGSSTIAHNIGWLFASQARVNTVITDLDLSFGTAGLNFNQEIGGGLADAIAQADRLDSAFLDRLLTKCGDNLNLLAANASLERDVALDETAIDTVFDVLRQSAPLILVDMPSAWSSWTRHTVVNADDVIITATPDLASMRNARNIAEILRVSRQNDNPPYLVLNQTGIAKRPEIAPADFAKAVGVEAAINIPSDPISFANAATTGRMICELTPKAKPSEEMMKLFRLLTNSRRAAAAAQSPEPQPQAKQASLIGRISGLLAAKK